MIQLSKKYIDIIISTILSFISIFIIYPHSGYIDFMWLVGAYLSPGNQSSFTGIFVFMSVFIFIILIGIGSYTVFKFFRRLLNEY